MVNYTPIAQPENFLKSFSVHTALAIAQSERKSVRSKPKRPTLVATFEDDASGVRVVHAALSVVDGVPMFAAKT
jgi:hypothetical protein